MKKTLLILSISVIALVSQAQTRYGFSAGKQGYDNYNVNDTTSGVELVVFTENNDTLKVSTGSNVSSIDGTARNGFEYNFSPLLYLFPIGTTLYNGSNRKKIPIAFMPNSTLWGKRYFYIKLTNFQGITVPDVYYNLDQLTVYIDYDGTNVGMPKVSVHDYKLFPIPATTELLIEGVNCTSYKVYDLTGRFIKGGETIENTIQVSELSNGLYVLHGISDKGLIVQKFLKE
ncbi:MAG: T9SS type A sorting domain-containing protein [Bacteroidia bacterium]|nr:T9SS type A sorting domain-containing protein [Bacteroidia bacterium]